jgi:hypothetical protein
VYIITIENTTPNDIKEDNMRKINFVRTYNFYGTDYYDAIYYSGRCVTNAMEHAPATVKNFIENAGKVTKQYDRTFKREETIYE